MNCLYTESGLDADYQRRTVQKPSLSGMVSAARLMATSALRVATLLACSVQLAQATESASADPQSSVLINPTSLIQAMSDALNTLNYEGTFVHAQGAHLTSMHILHSTDAYGELERLTSLDGEAREVIRNNSLVTCIWPDSQSVVVSKSKPRDLLPQIDSSLTDSDRYTFSMGEPDRVSGRSTHVVEIEPLDKFRYGYRFWIDTETYMLLRSMLLEGPNKPVEQVIFTDIQYPDSINPVRFNISGEDDRISWLEPKKKHATSNLSKLTSKQSDKVDFRDLPDGYKEVSETFSPMPIQDGPVSHVMLTDGMASVSVYVEYVLAAEQVNPMLGLSNMGAMNAYGVSTARAIITAVGEVPAETVKAIAMAVLLKE